MNETVSVTGPPRRIYISEHIRAEIHHVGPWQRSPEDMQVNILSDSWSFGYVLSVNKFDVTCTFTLECTEMTN